MNAVEFCFALGAVTMMTTVIYIWTSFVYKLDEQGREEGPERKTASASRPSARTGDHFAGAGVKPPETLNEQNATLQ